MRRAARVDANQAREVDIVRRAGLDVIHTHQLGAGKPDFFVTHKDRSCWHAFKLKNPKRPPSARKLTPAQEALHALMPIHKVESAYEILAVCGIRIGEPAPSERRT